MQLDQYHILLFIHLVSLLVGFGSVLVIDTFGLLWLLKKVKLSFVNSVANVTQRLIWLGWLGLVLSGVPLLYMKGSISGLTTLKIAFVLMIGLNGVFLHFIKKSMDGVTDDSVLPNITKFRITLATFISQFGWWGAIIIGFLNNKLKANAPVVENPFYFIVPFFIGLVFVAFVGELIFRKK